MAGHLLSDLQLATLLQVGDDSGGALKDRQNQIWHWPLPYEAPAGDPAELVANADKIRRELGWVPKYADLRSIVTTAWNWHRTHPGGYGKGA